MHESIRAHEQLARLVSTTMLSGRPARRFAGTWPEMSDPARARIGRRSPDGRASARISRRDGTDRSGRRRRAFRWWVLLGRHSSKSIARPTISFRLAPSSRGNCRWTEFREVSKLLRSLSAFLRRRASVKCNNILESDRHTPLIRLNRVAKDVPPEVYVKADYLNPGGSMKDRIAVCDDRRGRAQRPAQRPGGTIVEGNLRQYGDGPGAGRGGARIQGRFHHHRQAVARKNRLC